MRVHTVDNFMTVELYEVYQT